MAASRSLNEPVVMTTLVRDWAAYKPCAAVIAQKKTEKPVSLRCMVSSAT